MGTLGEMRLQDHIVKITTEAVDELFRNARAVPADKLEWSPMDQGRSVLDQIQECAQVPKFLAGVIENQEVPTLTAEDFVKMRKMRREWTTVDECERVCIFHTDLLCRAVLSRTEEELDKIVTLPFGPDGITEPLAKVAMRHQINVVWHTAQIAYIQVLLGDKQMH